MLNGVNKWKVDAFNEKYALKLNESKFSQMTLLKRAGDRYHVLNCKSYERVIYKHNICFVS
jgi:hypothetical protein